MDKLDLQNRMERVPELLRPNQVGPDGRRVKPSDGEIACNLVFALVVKGIAIAMVVIGAQNLDNCPAEPMVPKYLIAAGSLNLINGLLQLIAFLCVLCWAKGYVDEGALFLDLWCVRTLRGVLAFFTMIWFITGSVYVFGAHEPNYESEFLPNYCDETTYKFAFYTLILAYIFMLFVVGLFCGMCCCMCCCTCVGAAAIAARRNSVSSNEQQQQQQQQQQEANNA